MELLKVLGSLAFITGVWLLFLMFVGYGFGISGARRSGWVVPGQKIPGYVEISSPRLARLLMGLVGAWNYRGADFGPVLTKEELRAALKKEETP